MHLPGVFIILELVGVGALAGAASGFFGIGGGIISVPFLLFFTELSFREVVAVSLVNILLTAPFGIYRHARADNVRWRTGVGLGVGGSVGILVAVLLDPYLVDQHLEWLFAGVLLFASQRLAYGSRPLLRLRGDIQVAVTGVLGGTAAKLLGIGGGIIMVPALVFTGFSIHWAVATSLVAVFTNAALSTGINLAALSGDWFVYALPLTMGSILGIQVGSTQSIRSAGERLRRAFAVLLALVSFLLFHRSLQ